MVGNGTRSAAWATSLLSGLRGRCESTARQHHRIALDHLDYEKRRQVALGFCSISKPVSKVSIDCLYGPRVLKHTLWVDGGCRGNR